MNLIFKSAEFGKCLVKKSHMIYHYTSLEKFLKIIESFRGSDDHKHLIMWASSAYVMNDTTEMQDGYFFIESFFRVGEQYISEKKRFSSLMKSINNNFRFTGDNKEYFMSKENTPFILCFTKEKDFLPMWSMYGNNGNGVCLGFDEKVIKKGQKYSPMANVVYASKDDIDKEGLKRIAGILYEEAKKYYALMDVIDNENLVELKKFVMNQLFPTFSAFIKRAEFKYENEIRLVFLHNVMNNDVFFRKESRGSIIPYIKIKIPIESLKKIILGPCITTPENLREMETLREVCKQSWEIEYSKIPYRIL